MAFFLMNYDTHDITTAKVNEKPERDFTEAEDKAEEVIRELENTVERHKDKENTVDETAKDLLHNISHIKLYDSGNAVLCLDRAEDFQFYLISRKPKTVDLDRNHIKF